MHIAYVLSNRYFIILRKNIEPRRRWAWPKPSNYSSESFRNAFNRFLGSKNIPLEYAYAIVDNIPRFQNFGKKFPRSKKGVATLSFPQGLEFANFFLGY